ncbi:MAG: imidazolonepropionase, partial [Chitinophagaceae bacterium]
MAIILIKNIKRLVGVGNTHAALRGKELAQLAAIDNAYLLIEDELIAGFGSMNDLPPSLQKHTAIDATGRFILPGWCDSHTHLVFAASREDEFVDKLKGLTYAEIAARG